MASRLMRWQFAALVVLLCIPLLAHADPISIAVVAALGIEAGTTAALVVGTIISIGLSLGLGMITKLLMPKPDMRTRVTMREALAPRRTVYGFYHGPGVAIYLFSDGKSAILEEIHAFAAHECDKVGDLYLDKLRCYPVSTINGEVRGGTAPTSGGKFPFSSRAWFYYKTGAADNQVFNISGLSPDHHNIGTGAFPVQKSNLEFTPACVGNGICAIYVALKRSDHFNGVPSISIDLWGKKILDPRSNTVAWSDNAALCYLDYLITPKLDGGFGATLEEIDLDLFIAAANICDEIVDVLPVIATIFSINATGNTNEYQIIPTDPRGIFSGSILIIGGETATVVEARGNSFTVVLASSHVAGDSITSSSATEKRYSTNGFYMWDAAPAQIMTELLSSFGGIPTYINGKYGVYAAAWRPATDTLTDADLRAPIKVQALRSSRDLCNGIRGTFINNFTGNWQPDDLPPVIHRINPLDPDTSATNDFYLAQDDDFRRWKDVQFPFVTSPSQGQRLARIILEQNRRQLAVEWPGKMSCYQFTPPDTLQISRDRFAWSEKTFQVMNTRLVIEQDKNDCPYLATDLSLQETDANVYFFDGEQPMLPLAAGLPPQLPDGPADTAPLALSTYIEP